MILTSDRIDAHPQGQPLEVPRGTHVTSLAREAAEARGISIVEAGAGSTCGCAAPEHCSCGPTPAPPSMMGTPVPDDWARTMERRRKVDPSIWSTSPTPKPTSPAAAPSTAKSPAAAVLGPAETHVDACVMDSGGECREGVVVVTAVGRNRPHVLAELATGIADVGGDIQEISQRIVDDWFHTILTVDISRTKGAFPEAKAALERLSRDDDYTVRVQHERVFRYMHRI